MGFPVPQLTWTHNGEEATSPRMYHMVSSIPEMDSEGRGFIVTGTLSIFPLMEESTGNVTCIASSDTSIDVGGDIPQDVQEARLTVLGGCG